MTPHPIPYETLIALALGEPVEIAPEFVQSHLAECPDCQATLRHFNLARETVQLDAKGGPSQAALDRVRGLASRPAQASAPLFAGLRRVFGSLSFDGRQSYAAMGLRGTTSSYLLSFTQDDVTLDLEIEPPATESSNGWQITGQLDSPLATSAVDIAIVGGRATQAVTTSDEHGVFSFAIAPGDYDILISLGDQVVVFPEVNVG